MAQRPDVVVVGGGQAGLALGYWLRRSPLKLVVLDAEPAAGGAWQHGWNSLRLFSPAEWSSLPGWRMPKGEAYPSRDDVISYLRDYEARYRIPVIRPVWVNSVRRGEAGLIVDTDSGDWVARAMVSATGNWHNPFIPPYPDREQFRGEQSHSADYVRPAPYMGKRVLIICGGNSGAQILAEVSTVADTLWVTERPPVFLPDDVDGRILFERATRRFQAIQAGRELPADLNGSLGDVVMVPPVKDARARGGLQALPPFEHFMQE